MTSRTFILIISYPCRRCYLGHSEVELQADLPVKSQFPDIAEVDLIRAWLLSGRHLSDKDEGVEG